MFQIHICLRLSVAVKRHHDHGNSYKEKHLILLKAYSYRGLVYYHNPGEHGSMQIGVVLEK